MLFSPTSQGEGVAASSPARALPHSETAGAAGGGQRFCTVCCHCLSQHKERAPSPAEGCSSGLEVKRWQETRWLPQPSPSAVSPVLFLPVACRGVLSLSSLRLGGAGNGPGLSSSPSPALGHRAGAALCSAPALGTVLTLHSPASATLDSHFQGWVLVLLTGAQAGTTTNLGVSMYNTVNKMFFEIQEGSCVLVIFA